MEAAELPLVSLSLIDFLLGGVGSLEVVVRGGSGSWTVRMCFARASERVKALSHSVCH